MIPTADRTKATVRVRIRPDHSVQVLSAHDRLPDGGTRISSGSGYIDDMKSGVMDQLLSAPISRSAIITGQLLQQLVINALQSAIVLGIGWLAGARYPGGVGGIVLALAAATLLATIFCPVRPWALMSPAPVSTFRLMPLGISTR